jgi:hypothetical protein
VKTGEHANGNVPCCERATTTSSAFRSVVVITLQHSPHGCRHSLLSSVVRPEWMHSGRLLWCCQAKSYPMTKLGLHHWSEIVTIHRPQPISASVVKPIRPQRGRDSKLHAKREEDEMARSLMTDQRPAGYTGKHINMYGYVPCIGRAMTTGYSFRSVVATMP